MMIIKECQAIDRDVFASEFRQARREKRSDLEPEIARLPASTQYGGQASSLPLLAKTSNELTK